MPADCIKTVLEMDTAGHSRGLLADGAHFVATGRAMVAKGGPGALFVGMGPRLAETVSAVMTTALASALALNPTLVLIYANKSRPADCAHVPILLEHKRGHAPAPPRCYCWSAF